MAQDCAACVGCETLLRLCMMQGQLRFFLRENPFMMYCLHYMPKCGHA